VARDYGKARWWRRAAAVQGHGGVGRRLEAVHGDDVGLQRLVQRLLLAQGGVATGVGLRRL